MRFFVAAVLTEILTFQIGIAGEIEVVREKEFDTAELYSSCMVDGIVQRCHIDTGMARSEFNDFSDKEGILTVQDWRNVHYIF